MPTHTPPADVPDDCHALIRHAFEYWCSKHPAEGLPGRQHIDPVDVPALLPYIRLIEIEGEPPQFKIRLMGTESVEFFERDCTGFWYHELCPQFRGSKSEATLLSVIRTRRPSWRRGPGRLFNKKGYENIERIILPLAANGSDIDMLFVVHVFEKADLSIGGQRVPWGWPRARPSGMTAPGKTQT